MFKFRLVWVTPVLLFLPSSPRADSVVIDSLLSTLTFTVLGLQGQASALSSQGSCSRSVVAGRVHDHVSAEQSGQLPTGTQPVTSPSCALWVLKFQTDHT